jgi:hypothetical protein
MAKRIRDYIRFLEEDLSTVPAEELPFYWERHKLRIANFQHERHMHLIATLFFASLMVGGFLIGILAAAGYFGEAFDTLIAVIPIFAFSFICMIVDIFYIFHYYALENGVQKIYTLQDGFFRRDEAGHLPKGFLTK